MRKIFLIPLMTMLCVVMAWGVEVNVSTEAELRAALQRTDGAQINLLNDICGTKAGGENSGVSGTFYVPSTANVTLNLAGHSLTIEMSGDFNGLDEFAVICNNGNLTIKEEGDGQIVAPMAVAFSLSCFCEEAQNGFCFTNGGTLTINGGIFIGQPMGRELGFGYGNPVIFNQSDKVSSATTGSLTINGGTYILPICSAVALGGIIAGGGNIVLNGGRFSYDQVNTNYNISDFLGSGCTMEQVAFSESYASWVNNVYLVTSAASSGVIYATNGEEINVNVESTDILVKAGVTVTLKNGHRITCDNLAFEDETAQLIIEAGAAVIVNDEVTAASVDNIYMTMDGRDNGDGNSYLLIKAGQIQESHPLATVVLKSKAYQKANGAYVFQRFTVPTYPGSDTEVARKDIGYTVPTAMYGWDYANDTWKYMESESVFEPFQCYDMTTQAAAANAQYVFKCRLVGNGNAELPLQGHWNYYANSYTAPIDIAPVIRYLYDDYQGDVSSSVYVHHANGDYWDPINVAQVIRNRMLQTTIEPMQAFVLERINSSANNPSIDYTTHIYNPFMGIQPNNAPRRNTPVQLDFTFATMNVEAADGSRNTMEMYEGNQFDASFDNGYDVAKHMNENCFNMYFVAQEGNMAYLASDNVANTAITLDTKEATSYTVNFEDVTMEGYALRDNLTGTETELVSGNTYSFSAPVNSKIEGRFEIVATAKMPTAIENTEVKADKKGIYTLTGQYLGENFHALPAGVYVINGKKVVK